MISKYGILIRIFTTKLYNRYAVEKYCNNNIKGIQPINPIDNIIIENPINNSLSNVVLIDIFGFTLRTYPRTYHLLMRLNHHKL